MADVRCSCGKKVAEVRDGYVWIKCHGCKEIVKIPLIGIDVSSKRF